MPFGFQLHLILICFHQDFGRLLLDVLGANGVSGDDLDSWKGVLTVFVNGVSPKQ